MVNKAKEARNQACSLLGQIFFLLYDIILIKSTKL